MKVKLFKKLIIIGFLLGNFSNLQFANAWTMNNPVPADYNPPITTVNYDEMSCSVKDGLSMRMLKKIMIFFQLIVTINE